MTKKLEVYKCNICGNVTTVLTTGGGELVCCKQPMELLKENTENNGNEKHVPIIKKANETIQVSVGSIMHPMEDSHHIEWIELIADDIVYRKFLKPKDKPQAKFKVVADKIKTRAYCNLHGLWAS